MHVEQEKYYGKSTKQKHESKSAIYIQATGVQQDHTSLKLFQRLKPIGQHLEFFFNPMGKNGCISDKINRQLINWKYQSRLNQSKETLLCTLITIDHH